MNDLRGFLRWQFAGATRSLSFWGLMVIVAGVIAALGGCPAPWPFYITVTGTTLIVIDAARSWYRFSMSIYRMEQDRIMRELKKD